MIRKAGQEDFDFIYELYMHPQTNPFLLYEKAEAQDFKPIFDELVSKEVLFVFEDEGIPTGMCKLVPQQHRNSHIVYIGGLAIHPDHGGKGKGMKMLQEVITRAKERGFSRLELSTSADNERAIRLYTKAGFEKEGVLKKFSFVAEKNIYLDEIMMAYLF